MGIFSHFRTQSLIKFSRETIFLDAKPRVSLWLEKEGICGIRVHLVFSLNVMDCLHSISVADITFPHRERPASYGASNYAPPEVADLVWPRIRTAGLCFVYTLH